MKRMSRSTLCVWSLLLACLSACSTNVSRFQMPGTDLAGIQSFELRAPGTEPEDIEIHALIRSDLQRRGYQVREVGDGSGVNESEKHFVYTPDWHWDITPYLLELRVAIYQPGDETLIAQAQSLQSSLVRKSIEEVVERAMASLFNDPVEVDGDHEDE